MLQFFDIFHLCTGLNEKKLDISIYRSAFVLADRSLCNSENLLPFKVFRKRIILHELAKSQIYHKVNIFSNCSISRFSEALQNPVKMDIFGKNIFIWVLNTILIFKVESS